MAPPPDPRGTYLSTGWRIVGPGAKRLLEAMQADPPTPHLAPGPVDATLFAVQFTTVPTHRGRPTVERILDAVTDEVRETWADCPRLTRDSSVDREPGRFQGFRFRFQARAGHEWFGEAVWRSAHPFSVGAAVTTLLQIEERPEFTRVGVRVTADDGIARVKEIGAGQARPPFLDAIRGELPMTWLGGPLQPRILQPGNEADFVRNVVEDPARATPVALLSPLEAGEYVVPPDDLAWDLFGRAQLYVLSGHRQSFALTDLVGDRRMSCFRGAARCYMPGWSRHDDPYAHPLLLPDRLTDPLMRQAWLGKVGIWTGSRVQVQPILDEARGTQGAAGSGPGGTAAAAVMTGTAAAAPSPVATTDPGTRLAFDISAPPEARAEAPADGTVESASLPPGALDIVLEEMRGIADLIADLADRSTRLADEVERLRTISSVRSSSTNAIERRLARLETLLESIVPAGQAATGRTPPTRDAQEVAAGEDEGRLTLVEVVREAAEAHEGELLFLDSAHESAADSPYEDPERVRSILEAMARVSRRRQEGSLGTSLREAFTDLGIDYRSAIAKSTPARLRQQYQFRYGDDIVEAEEHIVLGNTYDPRRCLRIYFSSRFLREPRFVIGHVGRHFEVVSST